MKKRVAAYACASIDTEEQLSSYEAQVDHYTRHIQAYDEWDFVKVHTDEGISATSTAKRDGFRQMAQDALDGKIDLIITKSVSRFARNTVDSLTTVWQLKEKGVEVFFEKENIYTLDSKGELLITIMSSLAQEESRSISENVTWGQRKRMQDGKVTLPYKQFLGYEKGEDGLPKIVESEAVTVRIIYRLFLEGKTPSWIAKYLAESSILTPARKAVWQSTTVLSILQNEKNKGDAILQKTFCVDFLTKKMKVNEGEVPQYYVENSHPSIVTLKTFGMVQYELGQCKSNRGYKSSGSSFSGRVICGECGGAYGSKVWHSTSKYRRTIWQCNHKCKGKKRDTPHLYETTRRKAFVEAFNRVVGDKDQIIEDLNSVIEVLIDISALDKESVKLRDEYAVVMELIRKCMDENARSVINQDEYQERYNGLVERYEAAKQRLDAVSDEKQAQAAKRESIERFLSDLHQRGSLLVGFDEKLWYSTVDVVTVDSAGNFTFSFKNGMKIQVQAQKTQK